MPFLLSALPGKGYRLHTADRTTINNTINSTSKRTMHASSINSGDLILCYVYIGQLFVFRIYSMLSRAALIIVVTRTTGPAGSPSFHHPSPLFFFYYLVMGPLSTCYLDYNLQLTARLARESRMLLSPLDTRTVPRRRSAVTLQV